MGKVFDGIMGLVVGDALGVPFEFKERNTFKCTDMTGFGTYNQPAGTWSDDSSLTLATVQSIGRLGKIDLDDIMNEFCCWLWLGKYTPHGETFDVGNTTRMALMRYRSGAFDVHNCGGSSVNDNGNGSLMRILPLAFIQHSTDDIYNVSALTHAHNISKAACVFYLDVVAGLLSGLPKDVAIKMARYLSGAPIEYVDLQLSRDEIKSTGYVVDTLEAALWCFLNTDNYRDCVLEAVNLGGDTDTIAAVAGGLAGIYYGTGGEKGIPEEWINQIVKKDWIAELCERMECNVL